MKEITQRGLVVRHHWPKGPWDDEPDKMQWTDAATGLPCLIVRNSMGALCGYVGVPPTHPDYGADYDDVHVSVHGGLTFCGRCQHSGPICHTVEPGESDDVWWLGFDTAHGGDVVPGLFRVASFKINVTEAVSGASWSELSSTLLDGSYRDVAYVQKECARLADALVARATDPAAIAAAKIRNAPRVLSRRPRE